MSPTPRYRGRQVEQPYEVGEKRFASEGQALAFALDQAHRLGRPVTVREYGDPVFCAFEDEEEVVRYRRLA